MVDLADHGPVGSLRNHLEDRTNVLLDGSCLSSRRDCRVRHVQGRDRGIGEVLEAGYEVLRMEGRPARLEAGEGTLGRLLVDESLYADAQLTTREIGVSVAGTPTILPDNTIPMALRPRSAQIVDFLEGQTGNLYPRVNESTVFRV